jgi:hypothetical protein
VDVISIKPFIVNVEGGKKIMIDIFEQGEVISGFGFLKLKFNKLGDQVVHAREEVLGNELLSHAQFHTSYKNDPMMMEKLDNPIHRKEFLLKEEMQL